MLDKMKENVEESLIMPKVEYNSGIFMTWPIKQDLYSQLQPKHYWSCSCSFEKTFIWFLIVTVQSLKFGNNIEQQEPLHDFCFKC